MTTAEFGDGTVIPDLIVHIEWTSQYTSGKFLGDMNTLQDHDTVMILGVTTEEELARVLESARFLRVEEETGEYAFLNLAHIRAVRIQKGWTTDDQ